MADGFKSLAVLAAVIKLIAVYAFMQSEDMFLGDYSIIQWILFLIAFQIGMLAISSMFNLTPRMTNAGLALVLQGMILLYVPSLLLLAILAEVFVFFLIGELK
jgi:hypothetical protein